MGVPKFFRYISERYPCINETLKEYQIPEFDNLYLDMNGIIHVCSHDDGLTYCTSEEQIFKDIFYYIELMFRLIQPQKIFMMAVDGVAPRAKMNQQRGRRFRTAKDAEEAERKLVQSGEALPAGSRFDSNCITPGTEFMARLHEQLKFFIAYKVSTDKLWQKPKIVYSGHNVPGEGEHKIMDYIRYLRSRDDWDPNTRHCVHGLDADLIMLGLCSHEPHFSLLREEVKFTKKQKRPKNPEEIQFFLLHLSLLRDYLDCEFQELKQKLPFPYDLEKIIDDWVLIGFLVGNDFIPQLPNLHIGNNALHSLYQSYIEILPTLGGYINEAGTLNLERFEKYLDALSKYDLVNYKEVSMDLKYFESKTGKIDGVDNPDDSWEMGDGNAELLKMIKDTQDLLGDDNDYDEDDEDAAIAAEFVEYKVDYYKKKLEYANVTKEVLMDQAEGYIRAIIWNLQYYYNGCQSWSWYFPHHYSPYLSDLRGFKNWNFEFPNDKPFLPFQQLLAVLPAASRNILPKAFRDLMTSPTSPIIDYYPSDFDTDLNGKKQEWEAVVLIPFIKEDALLNAMEPCLSKLTDEERLRNTHGPLYIYEYTPNDTGKYKAPEFFPDIEHNHSIYKEVWSDEIHIPKSKVVKGLHPGAGEAQSYGFPTLKHVPFTAILRESKVRVFEQPSRGSNMILYVKDRQNRNTTLEDMDKPKENSSKMSALDDRQTSKDVDPDFLKEVGHQLLGKEIYVSWPHLIKARVAGVASGQDKFIIESKGKIVHEKMTKHEAYKWGLDACEIRMLHHGRMGIELGTIEILIYAHIVEGVKYMFDDKGNGMLTYLWSRKPKAFPYQTIVTKINMVNTPLDGPLSARIEKVFYSGAQVFMLDTQHYGSMATVKKVKGEGRVVVEVPSSYNEPDFSEIDFQNNNSVVYYAGHQAAQRLGISPHFLSRITGTIYIQSAHTASDKTNIGLNLKFNKSNQEVVGYTKKTGEKQWLYSNKCVTLVNNYMTKFPNLFEQLSSVNSANCVFFKDDIFPGGDGDEQVKLIASWLKEQDYRNAELRACGSSLLNEDSIKQMEQVVIRMKNKAEAPQSAVSLQVKPHHIHIPTAQLNLLVPDPSADHNILDRIVSVRESHTIPLGYRGTIIGIEKKEDELATLYDILFDDEIICGIQLFTETKRCYRLTKQAFINISYGISLQKEMSPHDSRAATQNWRKNDGHSNNELRPRQDSFNSAKGVNSNSTVNNNTSNTVSQFFSAYRQPNAKNIFLVGQQAKEDSATGCAISLKPQQPQPTPPSQPPKNVDAEFQAMWSQLQQKLPTSPPSSANPPLPSSSVITPQAVSEQTSALKKFLRINEGERPQKPPANAPVQQPQCLPVAPCGHRVGTCCAELASMCLRLGVAYPHCSQRIDHHSGEVSAVLQFADGTEFVGPKSSDRSKASERVSCIAVKQYPSILASKSVAGASKPPGMMGGPPGVPIPAARVPFPQGVIPMGGPRAMARGHGIVLSERLMNASVAPLAPRLAPQVPVLPNPPQQWCQQEPKLAVSFLPPSSQPPPNASRFNVNPFVPLQAQTAAIIRNSEAKQSLAQPLAGITDERLNKDVIRPVPQSPKKIQPPPPTSRQQRSRRDRIAAKFSTPLQK